MRFILLIFAIFIISHKISSYKFKEEIKNIEYSLITITYLRDYCKGEEKK